MIGKRAWVAGAVTMVGVAYCFGAGAPRPEILIEAQRLVAQRAAPAATDLASLAARLDGALEMARDGAARVLSGSEPPGGPLSAAADRLAAAVSSAASASAAVAALEAARRALDPSAPPLPAGLDPATVASIAAQLAGTAPAADEFASMRVRATDVPLALDRALAAVAADDLAAAARAVAAARDDHAALAGWGSGPAALPIWLETAGATIGAVERLVAALRAGDAAAAERAADDFERLAGAATTADRALQLAMSEGAGMVTAAPLSRLVDAIDALAVQRAALGRLYSGPASTP